ncbi:MAG: hypothetical protein VXW26_16705, partial [SAR324 cluster bacterium]|nr:hypothetical protein [SAR324 cluster bacterium]
YYQVKQIAKAYHMWGPDLCRGSQDRPLRIRGQRKGKEPIPMYPTQDIKFFAGHASLGKQEPLLGTATRET